MPNEQSEQVLDSLGALAEQDDELIQGFLFAAVYLLAIRQHRSPQDVVESIWKAMPTAVAWPAFRRALETMLEE